MPALTVHLIWILFKFAKDLSQAFQLRCDPPLLFKRLIWSDVCAHGFHHRADFCLNALWLPAPVAELATAMPADYTQTGLHCNRNNKVRHGQTWKVSYVCMCTFVCMWCVLLPCNLALLSVDFAAWTWPALLTLAPAQPLPAKSLLFLLFFRTLFSFEIWICRLHTQCMQLFEATRGGGRVERASDGVAPRLHLGSINASKAFRSTHSSSDSRRDDDDDDATCRRWSRLAGAGVVAVVVAVAVALWLPQLHPAVFFFRLGHVRDRDKKLRLCLDAVRSSRESGRERENPPIAQAYVILWEVLWIIPKHLK